MTAAKIRLLFAVLALHSVVAPGSQILTHILAFVSAPRATPRTANICGNTIPCFASLDDRGDRTN